MRGRWKACLAGTLAALTVCAAVAAERADPVADTLVRARDGMRGAVAFARTRPDLFGPPAGARPPLPSREAKMAAWGAWATVLDDLAALEAIRKENADFALRKGSAARARAFSMHRAAFLSAYRNALDFLALAGGNPDLDRVLDEAVPEMGLPKGAYARFKYHFLNVGRAAEFAALGALAPVYGAPADARLARAADEDARALLDMGKGKGPAMTARNAAAIVAGGGGAAMFPVQKGVATYMGETRVRRGKSALVSAAQLAALPSKLEPGDIVLERREWYLSNLGLPGFWTHVALYLGTPAERRAFFADPEVRAWATAEGAKDGDFESLLRKREPAAAAKGAGRDAEGHPIRIAEAIAAGVSLTSLEHSAAADSIAVLRPRLPRKERAAAILRAFHYAGRPYDYDFDFRTDSAIVCSELVYKCYEPAPGAGVAGIPFPLEEIMGRAMLTPSGIARAHDGWREAGAPRTDFVLFYDGYEKGGKAVPSNEAQFAGSWRRPKWHVVVQSEPAGAAKEPGKAEKP